MRNSNNMINGNYVPDDIVVDILSKLPSRSILRFKIVSKTWYSLISDSIFINLHTKRAPKSPKILYSTPGTPSKLQLLDYNSSSFNDCCLSGPINFPYCRNPKIIGSSCGLVCVDIDSSGYKFCIWNPLTRECRGLPNLSMGNDLFNYFHGLGYDSIANDFKLVISMDTIRYKVFSLNANSWKTITCPFAFDYYDPSEIVDGCFLYGILASNSLAIVLNGIFHWIVIPRYKQGDIEILALDINTETFQKVQLPQQVTWEITRSANLLEHKGGLCVYFWHQVLADQDGEIWMMKKELYGSRWVHLLSFKNLSAFGFFELPVLCISKWSEVEFHTNEKFSRCTMEEEDKLDKEFSKFPCSYGPVLYVETLVSFGSKEGEDEVDEEFARVQCSCKPVSHCESLISLGDVALFLFLFIIAFLIL